MPKHPHAARAANALRPPQQLLFRISELTERNERLTLR
jgi:hypothetical protein